MLDVIDDKITDKVIDITSSTIIDIMRHALH